MTIQNTLGNLDAQLANARRDADAHIAFVRDNRDLTDEAKRREIAKIHRDLLSNESRLDAERAEALRKHHEEAEAAAYAADKPTDPASLIAYRDAHDRAGALTPDESGKAKALRALEIAVRADDTVLATAIARAAHEHQWDEVTDRYNNAYPDRAARLAELDHARFLLNDDEHEISRAFRSMNHTPIELNGLPLDAIERLAAQP